jgi:hypothetical protein
MVTATMRPFAQPHVKVVIAVTLEVALVMYTRQHASLPHLQQSAHAWSATAAATVRSQVPVIVQETRHAAIQHTVPAGNATTAPAGTATTDPLCDKLGLNARSIGANVTGYTVLGPAVWSKTLWGRNCSNGAQLNPGQQGLCQLPQNMEELHTRHLS